MFHKLGKRAVLGRYGKKKKKNEADGGDAGKSWPTESPMALFVFPIDQVGSVSIIQCVKYHVTYDMTDWSFHVLKSETNKKEKIYLT